MPGFFLFVLYMARFAGLCLCLLYAGLLPCLPWQLCTLSLSVPVPRCVAGHPAFERRCFQAVTLGHLQAALDEIEKGLKPNTRSQPGELADAIMQSVCTGHFPP